MDSNVAEAVSGFAKTMGLNNFKIPSSGIIQFSFENGGTFFVEDKDQGTAVYLLRELPEHEVDDKATLALQLCHYKESRSFDVQSALYDTSKLVFLIWLPHAEISTPKIEEALQHLVRMHEKVEKAG
ncbi:MAG: type III secretion chaperone SycN [Endozoicomonadaceae bacterium]|nr:type III secretion chaperone SycN [Endozoicomonadaceae bacterium]MCY4328910.1 type III secretion chaperone SycN [Endozoicomonadaceae bacterium]